VPGIVTRFGEKLESKIRGVYYFKKFRNAGVGILSRNKKRTIIKSKSNKILQVEKGGIWKTIYTPETTVNIKKKPFMKPAGELESKNIPKYFKEIGAKKLKQILKK